LALARNSPRLRYWLWLAASLKFLVPFSLLVSTGARVQLPPNTPSLHAVTVQQISTYFAPVSAPARTTLQWPFVFAAIWVLDRSYFSLAGFATGAKRRLRCSNLGCSAFSPCAGDAKGLADLLTQEQFEASLRMKRGIRVL